MRCSTPCTLPCLAAAISLRLLFVFACAAQSSGLDVRLTNSLTEDFPSLSEEVLADALQDEDEDVDERHIWLDGEEYYPARHRAPRASRAAASCHRPCEDDGEPMICYFRWRLEAYVTMGRACGKCPRNATDCTAPQCVTADGFERGILTVNRKLPGPSIHVCRGDIVIVDVKNMMPGRSTSVHWHGLRQRDSPHMDGVPMVTQCPVPPGAIFRYRFRATEIGTHFWHSHDGMQKMDGIAGAMVVRGPRERDPNGHLYDHDLRSHTLVITDWFHLDADQRFPGLQRRESGQLPDSYLINGRGSYRMTVDSEAPYAVVRVSRGRRYRLRLVAATGASCAFTLAVQDHRLLVVAADVTAVRPVPVDSVTMSPGERYDVVLHADRAPAAYWIHVRGRGACALLGAHQVAVLRYTEALSSPSDTGLPVVRHPGKTGLPLGVMLAPENSVCADERASEVCVTHLQSLHPVPQAVLDRDPDVRLPMEFGFRFFDDRELFQSNTFHRHFNPPLFPPASAVVNNISNVLGPSPLLSQVDDIPAHLFCSPEQLTSCQPRGTCECLHVVKIPLGEVVEFVIADSNRIRNTLSHPFHIHGNYFYVVAQGLFERGQSLADVLGLLGGGEIPFSLQPVEKDTIAIPSGGYAVVRMVADNPGFWMFHCHFLYHLVTGMSVILQVGDTSDMAPTPKKFPTCGDFF